MTPGTDWQDVGSTQGPAALRGATPAVETSHGRPLDAALSNPGAAARGPEAPAWPDRLDSAAFHGLAGEFVGRVEPHTEADPIALLVQFLVMFGNLVGRGPHVRIEADRHAANLFAILVGATSKGRKGVSQGQARRPFQAVDETWGRDRIQSGLSSGEGLIWAVRDAIEQSQPVKEKGRVVDYQTVITDPGVEDKRLLVFEPEFASALRVLGRDGNTLSAIVRQAWDSGTLRVLTKTCPARATDAHISILGHITKGELLRYLDATEKGNGFANRFLFVAVRRSKVLPRGGALHRVDLGPIIRGLSEVLRFTRALGDRALTWDDAGGAYWDAIYLALSEPGTGLAGEVTSRAEAQVLRLSLLYALLDRSEVIGRIHVEAAEALWRYCAASVRWIFGDALGDPLADEILAELRRRHPEGMTRTELMHFFKRNQTTEALGRALAVLEERGLATSRKESSGERGRPAERWLAMSGVPENEGNEENEENPRGELNSSFSSFLSSPRPATSGAPEPPADRAPGEADEPAGRLRAARGRL